jgi:hypothetical protein
VTDPFAINRLIDEMIAIRLQRPAARFGDGIVATAEAGYASVRKGDPEAPPTPGFTVSPELAVQAGDHVWYFDDGGFKLIIKVLSRNAVLPDTGDWTPAPSFAVPGTSSWTSTAAVGRWAKLGSRVWLEGTWEGSMTKGTASGALELAGLPFTVLDLVSYYPYGSAELTGWTHGGINNYGVHGVRGSTRCRFFWTGSGGSSGLFDAADYPAGPSSLAIYSSLSFEAG